MLKRVKYSIDIVLIVFLFSVIYPQLMANDRQIIPDVEVLTVIYVPGWMSGQKNNHDNEKKLLKTIFNPENVEVYLWKEESDILYFPDCVNSADTQTVPKLIRYLLEKYPQNKLQNVVLVGHSLGGRIVIKTMSKLAEQRKIIRQGVFLGSAISFEDKDIKNALNASAENCINVFSSKDKILKNWYGSYDNSNALGAYGYKFNVEKLKQYQVDVNDHIASNYLNCLKKVKDGRQKEFKQHPEIKIPYPCPQVKLPDSDRFNVVDEIEQWRLIEGKREFFYIVDPYDRIRSKGNKKIMNESFEYIKRQLLHRNAF